MGTYNTADVELLCPRCGRQVGARVDLYGGDTSSMTHVEIGGRYPLDRPWLDEPPLPRSARMQGYSECPQCGGDFHCIATLVDGVLERVAPDLDEPPYIDDGGGEGAVACPECGSLQTEWYRFDGYRVGTLYCVAESKHQRDEWYLRFNDGGDIVEVLDATASPWTRGGLSKRDLAPLEDGLGGGDLDARGR